MEEPEPYTPPPTPKQLRGLADRLRQVNRTTASLPLLHTLSGRACAVIAAGLEELARMQTTTGREREQALERKLAVIGSLAASRRLPLAAVEGLVRRADRDGVPVISVDALRQALAAQEPKA